jgi:hypothetical protein
VFYRAAGFALAAAQSLHYLHGPMLRACITFFPRRLEMA